MARDPNVKGRGKMSMATAQDTAAYDPNNVEKWRVEAFERLGFSIDWSAFLGATNIDVRLAEKMLNEGANHEQVLQILAGTHSMGGDDPGFDWTLFEAKISANSNKAAA